MLFFGPGRIFIFPELVAGDLNTFTAMGQPFIDDSAFVKITDFESDFIQPAGLSLYGVTALTFFRIDTTFTADTPAYSDCLFHDSLQFIDID